MVDKDLEVEAAITMAEASGIVYEHDTDFLLECVDIAMNGKVSPKKSPRRIRRGSHGRHGHPGPGAPASLSLQLGHRLQRGCSGRAGEDQGGSPASPGSYYSAALAFAGGETDPNKASEDRAEALGFTTEEHNSAAETSPRFSGLRGLRV